MNRVCIVLPSGVMVHANFAIALASMCGTMFDVSIVIANPKGAYVHLNREHGVRLGLKYNASHILFIDTDMSFPPDTMRRLLKANKDIIGANYIRRTPPFEPLAATKDHLVTRATGLFEVRRMPTGLLLIKAEVFRRIPEPWFCVNWIGSDIMGEDYLFCDMAREHGFEIWMDTNLSLEVVHWGEIGFRWSERGFDLVTGLNGDTIKEPANGKMEAA